MARLVTKFKYLKSNRKQSAGGYAKYIATREGVEKIDSSKVFAPATVNQQKLIGKLLVDFPDSASSLEYQDYTEQKTVGTAAEFITRTIEENSYEISGRETYAKYIATRPRAEKFGRHGLFTDKGIPVSLSAVQRELNEYQGNIWTVIISLRREDAERLDYNNGARWRDMLRSKTLEMAKNLKINIKNLRWYAAFHNESHHPHVHLIVYSTNSKEGYLTEQGIENLRSAFAREIFAQDLVSIYARQTESRDKLRADSKSLVAEIVSQINRGDYDNPTVEKLLRQLSDKLSRVSGKKQYGYLKAEVKDIVDNIIIELSKDERIANLYDIWYEQREEVLRTYTDTLPERIPLVDNDTFKPIKNHVITEALKIGSGSLYDEEFDSSAVSTVSVLETVPVEPMVDTESADFDELDKRAFTNRSWWTKEYKQARRYLYGNKKVKPDFKKARELLLLETEKGNGFAMHDLAKMYLDGLGVPNDESSAEEYFAKALRAFLDKLPSEKKPAYMQYRIGKMYQQGYGTEQDYTEAALWFQKSVDLGNQYSAYSLASLYYYGNGVEQDYHRAYELYLFAAEKGNAYAQYQLAQMLNEGIGTAKDISSAREWYKKAYNGFLAIEKDMADDKLYYRLGQMNLNGIGTEVNLDNARMYFEMADKLKNTNAVFGLGKLYLREDYSAYNPLKAVDYLEKASGAGNSYAQFLLGKMYLQGEIIGQNSELALKYLLAAADNENVGAMYFLGKELLLGEKLPKNVSDGFDLLVKAMDSGNQYAKFLLAKEYLSGENIPRYPDIAVQLLEELSADNFEYAEYLLGKLYYQGDDIPQDISQAVYHFERAFAVGNEYAAYQLGKIFLNEINDTDKAVFYLKAAAEKGNAYAQYQLGKLYLFGNGVVKDVELAYEYLIESAKNGNPYALQLLNSHSKGRGASVALCSMSLLHHLSCIIQNQIEQNRRRRKVKTDRKVRQKINDKKIGLGLH